jgi:PEP-CTERM motif
LAYVPNRRKEEKMKAINKLQANPKKGYNYMKINYLTFLAVATVALVIGGTTPGIAAVITVANNSFEATTGLGTTGTYYLGRGPASDLTSVPGWDFFENNGEYRYNGLVTQGSSLLANSGGLQSWSPYPNGTTAGFVLGGGSFSQTLSGFEIGESYVVSFYAASRAPYADMFQDVIVKMDGQELSFGAASSRRENGRILIRPEANAWTLYSSDAFTAAASGYTLSFTGVYQSDRTAFIDVVNVVQIPEPATMSLLGLSGLMLVLRKRKSSKV